MAIRENKLSGALQENILTLLCFDTEACPLIINSVDIGLFESEVYRTIAERAADYYRKYKKAPAEHLPDLLEEFLDSPKRSVVGMYTDAVSDIFNLAEGINRKYVLDELEKFVRQQSLKRSVIEAAEALQKGRSDVAEKALRDGLGTKLAVFEKGTLLSKALENPELYDPTVDLIRTGIQPLDRDGICPAPGELYTVMGLPNRGKTWWLLSIGKFAALQRKKVMHVSLEMSELKIARRYAQAFFSMTRRKESFEVTVLIADDKGRFEGYKRKKMRRRPALTDKGAIDKLKRRNQRLGNKLDRIVVKQFPTNQLTTEGLSAYLQMMMQEEGFHPDMLVIDYADLMKVDTANIRVDTGRIYRDLRGLAVEHNIAVVTASQSNRSGEDQRILTMKNFAEDYSKAGISDNVITYNQTKEEEALGLARLFVVKARDEKRGQTVLISQAYSSGQFFLDAMHMGDSREYWSEVDSE